MRPHRAPTMEGEANTPGHAMQGKVFAIQFMKGPMDDMGLPHA